MRSFSIKLVLISAITAAFTLSTNSLAEESEPSQNYTKLFVFGGSLSDTGNLFATVGHPAYPNFNGRFSNGLTWSEIYVSDMEAISNNPNARNLNLAFGGAASGTGLVPPGFLTQITLLQDAINNGVAAPTATDLISVWIGANDYFAVGNDVDVFRATVVSVNQNTSEGINQLYDMGARNFLIFNLPDIGKTPAMNGDDASAARGSFIASEHNTALLATTRSLTAALADSNFIYVDAEKLIDHMIANPASYGFSNVTDACLDILACDQGSRDQQNEYLFWDSIHPTEKTHQLIAAAVDLLTNTTSQLEEVGSISEFGLIGAKAFSHLVNDHMKNADIKSSGFGVSVGGAYVEGDRSALSGRTAFDYNMSIIAINADYRTKNGKGLYGLSFGISDGDVNQFYGGGFKEKGRQIAAFAEQNFDNFTIDGHIGIGSSDYTNISRFLPIGNIATRGETTGTHTTAAINISTLFETDRVSVRPFAGFRYIKSKIDAYQEEGGVIFNLDVSNQELSSKIATVGVELASRFMVGKATIIPRAAIAYEHEFSGNRHISARFIDNTANPFTLSNELLKDNVVLATVGFDVDYQSFWASLNYTNELGIKGGNQSQISARVAYRF